MTASGRFRPWLAATCCVTLIAFFLPAPELAGAADQPASGILGRYGDMLGRANPRLSYPQRTELAERVLLLSSYYRIDPRLLIALVSVESAWRTRAVSPVGAQGLGQLMPGTAAGLGVDPTETYENLDGTARYLRRLLGRFAKTDERSRNRLALAAYNAGPAAVSKYGGVPPYAETRTYVGNVMALWKRFRSNTEAPHSGIEFMQSMEHGGGAQAPALPSFSVPLRRRLQLQRFALIPAPLLAGFSHTQPYPAIAGIAPERRARTLLGLIRLRRARPVATPEPVAAPGEDAIADQAWFLNPPRGNGMRR
ncbi:MAG: hypothetical protein NVSMB64_08040 [Candidatus Velthaea sp.]